GNVATKTITVTVFTKLSIDTVKSTDTQVVMHGKAGSQGRLFNDETGVKLGARFTFDATGTYVLKLGSPLASGTKLKVWYTYNQTATYRTTVVDATKPVITADNQSLTVGDSFDPKAGVTASDDLDGDITSKIAITSNNVDTKKAGTYSVTYSVSDAAGNMATKTITVTVNKAPDTTKPVITASNLSLQEGTNFDPKAGVTASDDTDGDITNKITVTSNNVDTSKAGTYSVTYSVSDAAGNVATKTITVTVFTKLSIDTVKSTDTQVVMHGKAGSQGRLFNDETGVKLGARFTFDATGTYVLKLGS
ncbi:immunoglobulin-like domain-containing protein, partial [Listeria riparia]